MGRTRAPVRSTAMRTGPAKASEPWDEDLPARRRFSVAEYYQMAGAGILGPAERVELLDGEILTMAPIGSRHAGFVNFLSAWFSAALSGRAVVAVQNPLRLDDGSEPEPDLMLLRPRADFYAAEHPGPRDVLLLIEVSETSLTFDREMKLPRYARAGVPEVWLANLGRRQVHAYGEPHGSRYRSHRVLGVIGTLTPAAFPDLVLPLGDLFAVLDAGG